MNNYKPLLVVYMPIGKKTVDKMRDDMAVYSEQLKKSYGDQYNLAVVGTNKKDWKFDGLFVCDDDIEKIKEKAKIKTEEILKELDNAKKKD